MDYYRENRAWYQEENRMLRILICDDDARALETIRSVVDQALAEAGEKASITAISNMNELPETAFSDCNIALLDIDFESSKSNGMDFAREIRSQNGDAIIIFVTNFIEYAPEGYEVQAFRYVLKRDMQKELRKALHLALVNAKKESLSIQVKGEMIDLSLDKLLYLEVQQHYVTAIVEGGHSCQQRKYSFASSLAELEERLAPRGFLRIHKSYLVNMKYLKKYQCRKAVLADGTTLRTSEKSYAENKKKFLLWKGKHGWNT